MLFENILITMPTTLSAFYTVTHPSCATVRFASDNADPGLFISIIHESMMFGNEDESKLCVDVYDFLGGEASPQIEVEDKDVLIVLAKRSGKIVSSQVFEVDLSAVFVGYLFIPRGGFNLLCEQSEQLRAEDLEKIQHATK
jgi:hypothetical protein